MKIDPILHQDPQSSWLRPSLVSSWLEIAVIVILYLGNAIYVSTLLSLKNSATFNHTLRIRDSVEFSNITISGSLVAALLTYLACRGWKFSDLKFNLSVASSVEGGALFLIVKISNLAAIILSSYIFFNHIHVPNPPYFPRLTQMGGVRVLGLAVFLSPIVNACFEEIGCMGYAFNEIAAKAGPLVSGIAVILIRLSYHTYQGINYLLGYAIIFAAFNFYYCRRRSLWGIILAHILFNLVPIIYLKIQHRY